jgi:putative hydrolase of the HAD superfamily
MPDFSSGEIKGIVFDLDGTLYVCERFASEIQDAAAIYISGIKRLSYSEAMQMMAETRQRLTQENGTVQTISAVCSELGGSVQEMHRFFTQTLRPEAYLIRDERVIHLLKRLSAQFSIYIYTNNNRILTARIMNYLGLDSIADGTFTIDDAWRAKPDEEMVVRIIESIGLKPEETLFVGDRYDIDLRVPDQLGCPVYLSQSIEQLLLLGELLTQKPSADMSAVR